MNVLPAILTLVIAGAPLTALAQPASAAPSAPAAAPPPPTSPGATPGSGPSSETSSEKRALAETLFFTARGLMEAERYPEACRKLEESYRLDAASGTLLNLARCHEKEGRVASAWGEYKQAIVEARRANRRDREEICAERVAALEPVLPFLTIDVPGDVRPPGLVVSRSGVELSAASWGVALPTDPGTVEILAHAPGRKPWRRSVVIELRAKQHVSLSELEIDDTPLVAAAPAGPQGWPARKTLGLVGIIAGVAGVGAGTVLGKMALDRKDESDAACPLRDNERRCSSSGASLMTQASGFAWGSNIAFGVGAVFLVGGGILFLTSPSTRSSKSATVTPGLGGVRLDVTF